MSIDFWDLYYQKLDLEQVDKKPNINRSDCDASAEPESMVQSSIIRENGVMMREDKISIGIIEEQKEEESKSILNFPVHNVPEEQKKGHQGFHCSFDQTELKVENMLANDSRLAQEIILSKLTLIVHKKANSSISQNE